MDNESIMTLPFILHIVVLIVIFLSIIFIKKRYLIIFIIIIFAVLLHWIILKACFLTILDNKKVNFNDDNKKKDYGFTKKFLEKVLKIKSTKKLTKIINQVLWFISVFIAVYRYTGLLLNALVSGLIFVIYIELV